MDFRFDSDERSLIGQAGAAFAARLAPERLTSGESTQAAWQALAADGWLHAGLAEADGGGGLPLVMVAAIAREAGRLVAGDGFVNNASLLASLVARAGGSETLALHVEHPGFLLADGRGATLATSAGSAVDWCFGVEPGLDAYRLTEAGALLRYPESAWRLEPAGKLALAVGTVTVEEDAASKVGEIDGSVEGLLAAAQVTHAAALVGSGEKALRMTVDHVLIREQFGAPIGRFQAIKHGLADVAIRLETAWNATAYAGLRPLEPTAVATALLQAGAASELAVRTMTQFHGGIAVTSEHPAHLYLKTVETGRWRFGLEEEHALRIAADLLDLERTA